MMEAKYPDGHVEHKGPSPLKEILEEAMIALTAGADVRIMPIHVFVGQGNRCKRCKKITGDYIHNNK